MERSGSPHVPLLNANCESVTKVSTALAFFGDDTVAQKMCIALPYLIMLDARPAFMLNVNALKKCLKRDTIEKCSG